VRLRARYGRAVPGTEPRRTQQERSEATTAALVRAARELFAQDGYAAASLDAVVARAGVTKGALYHHFESKQAVGLAVVTELLGGWIRQLSESLAAAADPIAALRAWVEGPPRLPLRLGCPLNNLAQEMSAVDETFRERIEEVFAAWRRGIAESLRRGQRSGHVRRDIDARKTASFILASLEGSVSLAKSARDEKLFFSNMKLLSEYIEGLRGHSSKE